MSELNYHPAKQFPENFLAIEVKKAKVKMNKQLYLGISILIISKALMYELTLMYNIFTEDFLKILTMMLKDGLIHLTMIRMIKNHFK